MHDSTTQCRLSSLQDGLRVVPCAHAGVLLQVLDVRATSDDALPRVVKHLHHMGGTSPDKAAMRAAAEAATAAEAARLKRCIAQEQAAAAAAADGHGTPKAAGRRVRHSSSAVTSPADQAVAVAAGQGFPVGGSASYAELAAMDSAAAAALSLPAAVQKHLLQKQLQQQLTGAGSLKGEAAGAAVVQEADKGAAAEQVVPAPVQQQPHVSDPAASTPSPMDAARGAAAAGAGPAGLPGQPHTQAVQDPGGLQGSLQQLLSQMHAVHALQAALATSVQQQQHPPAAAAATRAAAHLSQPLQSSQPSVAGLPQPLPLSNLLAAGGTQLSGVGHLLAAALGGRPPGAAAAAPLLGTASLQGLGAALQQSTPALAAAAASLLSNPAVLAAVAGVAAGNSSKLPNGAAPGMAHAAAAGDGLGVVHTDQPATAESCGEDAAQTSAPQADAVSSQQGVVAAQPATAIKQQQEEGVQQQQLAPCSTSAQPVKAEASQGGDGTAAAANGIHAVTSGGQVGS